MGKKSLIYIPMDHAKQMTDHRTLINQYDEAVRLVQDLAGFIPGSNGVHRPPLTKQALVYDIQPSVGYGHAAHPIVASFDFTDLSSSNSFWGVAHEIGHNYQVCMWSEAYGTEETVNLYADYVFQNIFNRSRLIHESRYSYFIRQVDAGTHTFEQNRLIPLMQIIYAFPDKGWDIYRQLNRAYRALPDASKKAICGSKELQYNSLYVMLSRITGHDLTKHFQAFKAPIADVGIRRVQKMNLPQPPVDITHINPEPKLPPIDPQPMSPLPAPQVMGKNPSDVTKTPFPTP